jgi:hypothetical protein
MGYYTDFELVMSGKEEIDKETAQKIFNEFSKREINFFFNTPEDIMDDDTFYANVKWYKWEKDMSEISEIFPEIEFFLSGNGEDSSDVWEAIAEGGTVRKRVAELVFRDWYTVDI